VPPAPAWWRKYLKYWVHLAISAAIIFVTVVAPHVVHYIRLRLPLRTSSLVTEAVARANENAGAAGPLGQPITAGWFVKGYIRGDETGWSEAKLWIPVRGPKGEGSLYAAAGRGSGLWVFSELELSVSGSGALNLLERPKLSDEARDLKPFAKAYLVPLGHLPSVRIHALADQYRARLGLEVEVVAPVPLESSAFDPARGQFVAESLLVMMRHGVSRLADDPNAVLIGVTQQDMYIAAQRWRYAFSYRHGNAAVVSTAHMRPFLAGLRGKNPVVQSRLRKMVAKNLGLLVYRLPPSRDPSSVLYANILGPEDLDVMSESFQGLGGQAVVSSYTTRHSQAPVTPELKTASRQAPAADAEYPCLAIRPAVGDATGATVPTGKVSSCPPDLRTSEAVDTLEIDLRFGAVVTCWTDLVVADVVPLMLTRCHRSFDEQSRAFGVGGNLAYDLFPVGSRQPYTWMKLIFADGARVPYDRISKGTGYADAVYEHAESATRFRGSRVRWNGTGWDLLFADGALWNFPDSYAATRAVEGALTAMRDGQGRRITIERDRHANLVRLTSPGGKTLEFQYDRNHRITRASASTGVSATYEYDVGGRLVKVQDGAGRVVRYTYDRALMRGAYGGNDRPLFTIDYVDSLPSRIVLGGTAAYTLRFALDSNRAIPVTQATIEGPDGTQTAVNVADRVREALPR
jgi:YD repeat-containing protein